MDERKSQTSGILKKSAQAASSIKGAVKTGKQVASAMKGAAAGPYGTAAVLLWQNRKTVGKIVLGVVALLMLPLLFLLLLPGLIFGSFADTPEMPVLNNDTAIYSNIESADLIISTALQEAHDAVIRDIAHTASQLGESISYEILDDFAYGAAINNLTLISQYSASRQYDEINLDDFRATINAHKNDLFTYTSTIETRTNEDGVTYAHHVYTVTFVGEQYFAENVFALDSKRMDLAYNYAENLSTYLYGEMTAVPGATNISPDVLQYNEAITHYCNQFGISQFHTVICAIMTQESHGKGTDPMQCSESGYNTRYPRQPGAIQAPEYSIEIGVQTFADCLKQAGCNSPSDISRLSLALQSYNFGSGYCGWALKHYGGYSLANAKEFSNMKAEEMGWKAYGDPDYVPKVLGFLRSFTITGGTEGWGSPFPGRDWRQSVTSEFGTRIFKGEVNNHTGLDIGYPTGTPISAVKDGIVEQVIYSQTGFGRHVIVNCGDGIQTLYAHMSQIQVAKGQQVTVGTIIGKVGSTGNSTGPHLHLEVRVNGNPANPRTYIQ